MTLSMILTPSLENCMHRLQTIFCVMMMSLFICISKLLLLSSWQQSSGELPIGEEVTVDPDLVLAGLWNDHSAPSYWAKVVECGGSSETAICTEEDGCGRKLQMQQKLKV